MDNTVSQLSFRKLAQLWEQLAVSHEREVASLQGKVSLLTAEVEMLRVEAARHTKKVSTQSNTRTTASTVDTSSLIVEQGRSSVASGQGIVRISRKTVGGQLSQPGGDSLEDASPVLVTQDEDVQHALSHISEGLEESREDMERTESWEHYSTREQWRDNAGKKRELSSLSSRSRTFNGAKDMAVLLHEAKDAHARSISSNDDDENPAQNLEHHPMRRCLGYPGSPFRTIWDMTGGLLIFYDLITIPLMSFSLPESDFLNAMNLITLLFWTANMWQSVTVGFVRKGVTIMDPWEIWKNYLKGMFLIDLVVVVPDWVVLLSSIGKPPDAEGSGTDDSVRILRIIRVARIIRLLRILKLKWLIELIKDFLDTDYAAIMFDIVKMIVLLLCINHVVACLWFWIATVSRDSGLKSWIHEHGFADKDIGYQYLTSAHWAISQFTPASMDVQPHSWMERLFAICVVVFALIGFAYIVGSITGSLTQLRNMAEQSAKEFSKLRRFLRRNKVPQALSLRIRRYVEFEMSNQKQSLPMSSVSCLKLLSEQLTSELLFEINLPHISVHPLFAFLGLPNSQGAIFISKLAKTFARKQLARGDVEFLPGEQATAMRFVITGRLVYTKVGIDPKDAESEEDEGVLLRVSDEGNDDRNSGIRKGKTKELTESDFVWADADQCWLSEPVLWTSAFWHMGVLTAASETTLMQVEEKDFCKTAAQYPQAEALMRLYAQQYVCWLNVLPWEEKSDLMMREDAEDRLLRFIPFQSSS
eukprot:TRINITY_DN60639_c0_g1_i1.p1 TRINITY_DN60639_c0_g1~~TRINITY_DN60639_c0_g1_i1.p1  ORF type:complete len:758 (+),score=138.69 TRINITY_DN60639_c0_g1_i1:85-2358(+)